MTDAPSLGPEQQFFADPALDRMMGVVMAMAQELYVTRDRLRGLETLLGEKGVVSTAALDRAPTEAEARARQDDLKEFVGALLTPLLAQKTSHG